MLRDTYAKAGAYLLFVVLLAVMIAPKVAIWLLPVIAVSTVVTFPARLPWPDWRNPVLISCAAFGLLVTISLVWTRDVSATQIAAGVFVTCFVSAWIICAGILAESDDVIAKLRTAIVAAVAVGAAYLLIEIITERWLERWVFTQFPSVRPPSPAHVGMLNGRVAFLPIDELNRGVALLCLLLWPALSIVRRRAAKFAPAMLLALLALVGAAVFLSAHASSKLGLLAGGLIFLLHMLKPRAARFCAVAAWLGACLLVVPVAHLAYNAGLHQAEWLDRNARARIIIWGATAERYWEAPLLGIGAAATKSDTRNTPAEERSDHVIPWQTGAHAHNVYLQVWYELGIAGAVLLLLGGLAVLRWIFALPGLRQRYMLSMFAAAAVISAFSWGIWQPWFVASVFLCAAMGLLAVRDDAETSDSVRAD